jgi:hypothetical protein
LITYRSKSAVASIRFVVICMQHAFLASYANSNSKKGIHTGASYDFSRLG